MSLFGKVEIFDTCQVGPDGKITRFRGFRYSKRSDSEKEIIQAKWDKRKIERAIRDNGIETKRRKM